MHLCKLSTRLCKIDYFKEKRVSKEALKFSHPFNNFLTKKPEDGSLKMQSLCMKLKADTWKLIVAGLYTISYKNSKTFAKSTIEIGREDVEALNSK